MTREEFRAMTERGIVFLDGATGTNLQSAGMPVGVCPEAWVIDHPDVLLTLQRAFIDAGTNILLAPTFTGNRIKLSEYGLEERLVEINTRLVQLSKEAAGDRALVAGDMTMTGQLLYPMGTLQFEELVDIYKEQAKALYEAGADLFIVETMMSLQECRAAVLAIRETCDLPILVSMTFEQDGRTLYGTTPDVLPVALQDMGVDAIGTNCSTGPGEMRAIVQQIYDYAHIPVLAKPNDGLPVLVDGRTTYPMTPGEFAQAGRGLVEAGARLIGGCCGTTPEHIRALHEAVRDLTLLPVKREHRRVLSSERQICEIDLDSFRIIGERINPTGKKKLQAELRAGSLELVSRFAREQEENGASILDINMGTNGIDEREMMLRSIYEVTEQTPLPLCIDSSFPEVIEAALRIYPGRALINSISCETKKFEQLLPIAKKYGAMFILLPVSDDGIPATVEEKHRILDEHIKMALDYGFTKEDIVVDALVATVGADPESARSCLATFRHCKEDLGIATVCGLSNISFGLPQRSYVNAAFLSLSIAAGLTLAIANPSQDLLMNSAAATALLLHHEGSDLAYIGRMQRFSKKQEAEKAEQQEREQRVAAAAAAARGIYESLAQGRNLPAAPAPQSPARGQDSAKKPDSTPASESAGPALDPAVTGNPLYQAVLSGSKSTIADLAMEQVNAGADPSALINDYLIPAINEVGVLFDRKEYFLPQLIASANAMEQAIARLEPLIQREGTADADPTTIVIATVEGDVHDIGKNLVALMLRNYGYNVIDLGKDVPAADIVGTAMDKGAAVIGLSALMTTTMLRMKDVVELAKERGYAGKIIIGGAAVTPSYAQEIGADGYSRDAAECVQLVKRLLGE